MRAHWHGASNLICAKTYSRFNESVIVARNSIHLLRTKINHTMGQEIQHQLFSEEDFSLFQQRLCDETSLLGQMFSQSRFINNGYVGGLELEACLIDASMCPAPFNSVFLRHLGDSNVVPELAAFNFEINVEPQPLSGRGINKLQTELENTWSRCQSTSADMGGDVIAIGVLPSLNDEALNLENMSESTRYRALNEQVLSIRNGRPITLAISGHDNLNSSHHDVMLESAATSFQIHLQVPPDKGVRLYNAALIASAPLLAMSANSAYVFGRDLWDESRIPLFEQSIDVGQGNKRVTFGNGYVEDSLLSCFEENLQHYPVLLPDLLDEPPRSLAHLRLHNGTVWRWNRPLIGFDQHRRAHLRIENRVVPAGPTMDDMLANAAFFWGLTYSLANQDIAPETLLGFEQARTNFYQTAQHSLGSEIVWLDGETHDARRLLVDNLLSMVEIGLESLNIDSSDIDHYMNILFERADKGQNGARWQRNWVAKYGPDMNSLSRVYLEMQKSGQPVASWKL